MFIELTERYDDHHSKHLVHVDSIKNIYEYAHDDKVFTKILFNDSKVFVCKESYKDIKQLLMLNKKILS